MNNTNNTNNITQYMYNNDNTNNNNDFIVSLNPNMERNSTGNPKIDISRVVASPRGVYIPNLDQNRQAIEETKRKQKRVIYCIVSMILFMLLIILALTIIVILEFGF